MIVLLAGAMAQTLPPTLSSGKRVDRSKAIAVLKGALGAEQDYAKVKELQNLLRNITYPATDPASSERITAELKAITDPLWARTQTIVEDLAGTITELASLLVGRMVMVEQWGRVGDTYEVVFTREMLERLPLVRGIPVLSVWS